MFLVLHTMLFDLYYRVHEGRQKLNKEKRIVFIPFYKSDGIVCAQVVVMNTMFPFAFSGMWMSESPWKR